MKTAQEIVEMATKAKPDVIYRAANDGNSVAAWHNGQWIPVAGAAITGEWVTIDFPFLLVNGKPAFDPSIYGDKPEVK